MASTSPQIRFAGWCCRVAMAFAALACSLGQTSRAARPGMLSPVGTTAAAAKTPAQRPHPAVVRVIAPEEGGTSYGSGTLVDVRGDYGLILTNWHVVADATGMLEVVFPDGFRSAARLITTDRTWDLAALAIWRPKVEPVPLAARPPQPGEPLTIAGYGSGTYRAVTGKCTQYVAPGLNKPYEMVELSVAARQGDSGGPILNSRGELAGVLWGAGWGTTSGSYSGRVAAFVAAIMPPPGVGENAQLATNAAPVDEGRPLVPVQFNAPAGVASDNRNVVVDRQTTAAHAIGANRGSVTKVAEQPTLSEPFAPTNIVEQIELFLAFVGGAALLMHGLRLVMPAG